MTSRRVHNSIKTLQFRRSFASAEALPLPSNGRASQYESVWGLRERIPEQGKGCDLEILLAADDADRQLDI